MKLTKRILVFLLILTSCQFSNRLSAKVILPVLFSDNMVLQQKTVAPVWGTCAANRQVKVRASWNNVTYKTVSDNTGKWALKVETPEAGGPFKLTVSAEETIVFNNVMVGEVWLCSGQSNMEMPLGGWGQVANFENEIATANYPNIRLLQVEKATALSPVTGLKVMGDSWLVCSPKTIPEFSATAYFFARSLSERLNGIPIGLINTSWGGTAAEVWTSEKSLGLLPEFNGYLAELKKVPTDPLEQKEYIDRQQNEWNAQIISKDHGFEKGIAIWTNSDFDDSNWKTMLVPQYWEEQQLKDFDGVVWFRKTVDLPSEFNGKDIILNLGTVDDNEITFFNGQQVGDTEGYDRNRNYSIPGKLVKAGRNVITVRVFDSGGGGGFYGDPKNVFLVLGEKKIALSGQWKFNTGLNMKELEIPKVKINQVQPTTLFNAMIHPLVPYAIRGAIWYQGEANVDRAKQYSLLFPLMIHDWRKKWNTDFPFYFVQLANYLDSDVNPQPSPWAELREAQRQALSLTNTGMVVTIDIGNSKNIHPKNKQEVGRRLALQAAANTYGQKVVFSGPVFHSFQIVGSKIDLKFSSVGGGLKIINDKKKLSGFAIAGVDKIFYWADAEIQGDKIIVSSKQVEFPVAVRYGWSNNPDCSLYNTENLPASPFRTDDWSE